jgi:major membrane immunogen (membrane-anchored lipoprotein)
MRNKAVILILAVAVVTGACSKSPSDVVVAAYMAANDGKYSEANSYVDPEILSQVGGDAAMKQLWDLRTEGGTIQRIEILREEVRGETAKVYFRIHLKDGSTEERNRELLKKNGKWKMID